MSQWSSAAGPMNVAAGSDDRPKSQIVKQVSCCDQRMGVEMV
jgi:hypothetical protein